ncbi:AI-2E family transporter [Natronomonas sp.]|uniref:AI-2E family transporter n=1 Tax=Natronomonas sp. TaxID=2184060 RepID=UPI002FC2BDDE
MDENKAVVAVFGLAIGAATVYVIYRFIAAFTIAAFLYYSTRKFYNYLSRLRIPARTRAVLTLSLLGLPLLFLLSYTLVLMVLEVRRFVQENPFVMSTVEDTPWFQNTEDLPQLTIDGLIRAYQTGQMDPFIDFAVDQAGYVTSILSSFVLNLFIIVVVTYYLLIEGWKIREWLLDFEDGSTAKEFFQAADEELEAVLYGNLLNVIAIAIIAVVSYLGYNAFAPSTVEVPYPVLAGVLTGIASLIPVVGMKIVYIPLAAAAALPSVLGGDPSMLIYVVGFLALAVVIVDTIPDLLLRPYLSGNRTHVGLLLLAYIFGPIIFGFYGLFLAPILLVLALTFVDVALPPLLGAEPSDDDRLPPSQRRLDEF